MMSRRLVLMAGALAGIILFPAVARSADAVPLVVLDKPLHAGRISPLLYGGFVELLDDHVVGMWAEMLGDRNFEGVVPAANWDYYLGAPNLCDRDWDKNETWTYSTESPWNGTQSARLTAAQDRPAQLAQSQLAVRKGMTYLFSGYFRGDPTRLDVSVRLKALLPDGQWMFLSLTQLPRPGLEWTKFNAKLVSTGTTDRAVFEVRADGAGSLWVDKLSLMPADHIDGWRRDVVAAVKELRPPILRWGGSTVDPGGYRWKDGIGDRDQRTPFLNRVWGRRDAHDVGVEEFIGFCRAVGSEPLICVSYADGPQSAAELVEYCNGSGATPWGKKRVENGHPEPYGVKYWQLGNEVGNTEVTGKSADFCAALKKADPAATILTSFPSPELLAKVGSHIRYLGPHYYSSDLVWVESDIDSWRRLIGRSEHRDTVRLAITEWNIDAGNWGLGRGKLHTLDCALFEARFLNLLHRNSDIVAIACRSNLVNSLCAGTIQTNAAGLYKVPGFHAMKLFRDHTQPVPLTIAQTPHWLNATACAAEDRKSLSVFAVNTRSEPAEIRLDLSILPTGMKITGGEVVGDTQDRRQIDVANGWERPERVKTMPLSFQGETFTLPALSVAAVDVR